MSARAALSAASAAPRERPLPVFTVLAAREAGLARLHEAVIGALMREKLDGGLTEEALAARLGRTVEEIDAFLASPEGWTFDTMIDVLTAAGLRIERIGIG
jgi:hypothetical protein